MWKKKSVGLSNENQHLRFQFDLIIFFDLCTFFFSLKKHTLFTIYAQNISNFNDFWEKPDFLFVKFEEISCTLNSVFAIQLTERFDSINPFQISKYFFFEKNCLFNERAFANEVRRDRLIFAFYKTKAAWMTFFLYRVRDSQR